MAKMAKNLSRRWYTSLVWWHPPITLGLGRLRLEIQSPRPAWETKWDPSFKKKKKKRAIGAWGVAQWWNTCLACVRPWAQALTPRNKKWWHLSRDIKEAMRISEAGDFLHTRNSWKKHEGISSGTQAPISIDRNKRKALWGADLKAEQKYTPHERQTFA